MSPPAAPRVLCLEAAPGGLGALPVLLREAGYQIEVTAGVDGLTRLRDGAAEALVLQGGGPGDPWEEALRTVGEHREAELFLPVLLVTPDGEVEARRRGLRAGADACVEAGAEPGDLLDRLAGLLRMKAVQDRMQASRRELRQSAGPAGVLEAAAFAERVRDEVRRARRYHEPVALILLGTEPGVLPALARRVRRLLREVDRLGLTEADVLGVLLPNTHLAGALKVAERLWALRATARAPTITGVGVTFYPSLGIGDDTALGRLARASLERARGDGTGRICVHQGTHYFYEPAGPGRGSE